MARSKQFYGEKFVPGSDADAEDIFDFPYIIDENTVNYIKSHGRIMFIVRGLPGTGKRSLSKLIANTYPGSEILSADNYFQSTFVPQMRSYNSKRESHFYCHRNVLKACEKSVHPIIVCNSHVRKVEMDEYLKMASKFNYTIIMADTSDKFIISPEILAKSNAQGLDVCYFKNRIKQWQKIFPFCTGWFISPCDSHHIFNELLNILKTLEVSEIFQEYSDFEIGSLSDIYLGKELLFCIAGCGTNNFSPEMKRYYSSKKVKRFSGQCFEIHIFAFIFTHSDILAIGHLDDDMKKLLFRHDSKTDLPGQPLSENSDLDQITSGLSEMKVSENVKLNQYSKTIQLQLSSSSTKPCFTEPVDVKNISVDNCSFIHVAEKEGKDISPCKFQESFLDIVRSLNKCNITTNCDKRRPYSITFLDSDDVCVVFMTEALCVKSVFTGLYI